MKFLRNFFAAFLALGVFTFMGFVFLLVIASAMEDTDKFTVQDNSVLKIDLSKQIADLDFKDPLAKFNIVGADINRIGIVDLRMALEHAATDDKIKGVVLYAPTLNGGYAYGQEARRVIKKFKESGKFVWAYADLMSEGGYYISSVADRVYINPQGMIEWNGLDSEMIFFKGALDKLGIEPQIFRVGDYKSAVEPFMLKKMSDDNREQVNSMLNSIYNDMVDDVAQDVELSATDLHRLSNKMTVQLAQDAVDNGLITGLLYRDEFEQKLAEEIGVTEVDEIHWASYSQYNTSFSDFSKSKNKIAVIIADGEIRMGKSEPGVITPGQFTEELRKAREDDNVKAIVFRINSPGGDALASDIIWREVALTAEVKPIIASMANYGASGGYYLAMAADTIVAEPTTLTGSIGIFGMVFNISEFMVDKLGITTDRASTGEYSNMFTSSRALTEGEKQIIQNSINAGYETFTTKAAQGRNMDINALKKIASGRVWTGSQAKENGLVDILGGLDTAVGIAAEKAGIVGDYKVRYYPERKTALEEILDEFSSTAQAKIMEQKLGDIYQYVGIIEKVKGMSGIQARMPYEVNFK